MLYKLLADLTVVVHLGFIGFVAVGGFFASRYPVVLFAHVPAVIWALGIVTVGWPCPLTGLENWLRQRAGGDPYDTGFVDRYLTGVLYPEQYERAAQALVGAAVVASYVTLVLRRRSPSGPREDFPTDGGAPSLFGDDSERQGLILRPREPSSTPKVPLSRDVTRISGPVLERPRKQSPCCASAKIPSCCSWASSMQLCCVLSSWSRLPIARRLRPLGCSWVRQFAKAPCLTPLCPLSAASRSDTHGP